MRSVNQETAFDTVQETAPTERVCRGGSGLSSVSADDTASTGERPVGRKAVGAVIRRTITREAWTARTGQRKSRTLRLRMALGRGQVALESGEDSDF